MSHRRIAVRPSVSVMMCVYRPDPCFFPAAVESVLAQTHDDLELVIVEDPSERCGRAMLPRDLDCRVRYYTNSHRTSLIEQRNRALAESRGELIAVLDADDLAEPDRFERQAAFLDTHVDLGLVGTQVAVIDGRGAITGHRRFPLDHRSIVAAMHRVVPFCQPSVMYRKQAVLRAGAYQSTFGTIVEDYDLYSRLILAGVRTANLPATLTRYRLHAGQAKAKHLRATIRTVLAVKRRYWWATMDLECRLRMLAERSLLCLPQAIVFSLLTRMYYRDEPPPPRHPLEAVECTPACAKRADAHKGMARAVVQSDSF
ncbi:MAG TPA: glycosyltransferase [Pirellulales bacterium]|nr:glycosyltransferase [Pirellulales bacterium]